MTDRTTSIRGLIVETRTESDLDTVTEQQVTRALAHESRRRNWPRRKRHRDHEIRPRSTR